MKFKSVVLTGTAVLMGLSTLKAQKADSIKLVDRLSVGANFGTILTYTDLKQYDFAPVTKFHNEVSWGGGINAMYTINSIFGIQGQFIFGGMSGTDRIATGTSTKKNNAGTNSYFTGSMFEPSLNVYVNFTNLLFDPTKKNRKLYMYGYVGLGMTSFRSVRYKLVNDDSKDPVIYYQGYNSPSLAMDKRTNEVVMPVGLGVKYKLSDNFSLNFETSVRFVNTDKLDSYIANGNKDSYQYTALGFTYSFGKKNDYKESQPVVEQLAKMEELIDGFGDKDGDGVADKYDKDQKTPAGVKAYADGTSVDSDGDGVADYLDKEKFSNAGAKVDENGVESDADGDHVADSRDLEPNTAKGAQVDVSGVTIKTGGSTVVSGGGSYTASGLPSLYFDVNATTLDYKSYDALTTIAKAMKANPNLKLVVVGHADAQGSSYYNQKLALKRAEAVVAYLVKVYGVEKSRLSAESKGSSDRLTTQKSSMADRRVDIMTK